MPRRPAGTPSGIKMKMKRPTLSILAVSAAILGMFSAPASAETLKEALSRAYLFNPTLKAARAQLRAVDENVARAKSGFRPTVNGQVSRELQSIDTSPSISGQEGNFTSNNYSVTLVQPIFRGFRTINAVQGAQAGVEAGREDLRAAEQAVLLNTVTAYVNVVRDQAVLNLQQNNQKVLQKQLKAAQDRFEVGEVTKTDVAQARARASGAESAISQARAQLQADRATFAQLVGNQPEGPRDPGPSRLVPKSQEESLKIGEGENPTIIAAIYRERAQEHSVQETKGELLPSVSLQANYTRATGGVGATDRQDVATVTGVVNIPIYQGGEEYARIRQGIETRSELRHRIDEAREQVRASIVAAWGNYAAARAQITSDQSQVDANRVALAGVREEEKVGQRTVLDVLNAEQELLNSEVSLATSRRNLVVASYDLLASIGRISAAVLNLSVEQYDPSKHYDEVSNKWIGWNTSTEESEKGSIVMPVRSPGRSAGQREGSPAYTEGSLR
jgi:outer membrane protein